MPGQQNPFFRASWLCWLAFSTTLHLFSALLLFGQSSPILFAQLLSHISEDNSAAFTLIKIHLHICRSSLQWSNLLACELRRWQRALCGSFHCAFLPCPPCGAFRPCVPPPSSSCNKSSHLLSAWAVVREKKFTSVSCYRSCDIFITKPSVLTGLVTSFTAYFYFEHWGMILH